MARKSSKSSSSDAALKELRAFGLRYPGAHTKSPWPGHFDLAVNDKTFAYLSLEGEPFSIGCKLPYSCAMALKPIPVDMFKAWIDESYRAQAPKRLVAHLPASESGPPPAAAASSTPRTRARTRSAARRTTRRSRAQ